MTSVSTSAPPRTWRLTRAIAVAIGIGLATTGIPGLLPSGASAASVNDGSDWGPQGTLTSDSSVTVRWDNTGNPDSSIVRRDGRQHLPHTGGKTYDDVAPSVATAYDSFFGTDNGRGGLAVSVSQTRGLVNQAVTVSVSGSNGGLAAGSSQSTAYFQVFQCWGGLTSAGKPDTDAEDPDPATCQVGAQGPDTRSGSGAGFQANEGRRIGTDTLVTGGDWEKYYGGDAPNVPFTAISGEKTPESLDRNNEFFTTTTTNELSDVVVDANGTATRQFELQTTLESAGLGCGVRSDVPSTGSCWLVVVPRIENVVGLSGPISPSVWAQRLQVRLGFSRIALGCPGGQARSLLGGSELLAAASSTWTPGVCTSRRIALGYTQLGDQVARNQLATGASSAILTSQPVTATTSAIQVPVAIAAPVLAYQFTYQPQCLAQPDDTEERARECGYDDLAAMRDDAARAGTPIRDLRLDARLVAKLLTQSYLNAIIANPAMPLADWGGRNRPGFLTDDPEFKRLNPGLTHLSRARSGASSLEHLILEAIRSDAANQLWQWLLADTAARSFLDGCPDPDGMTINPFYSTRTYAECSDQAATLSAQADADRAATTTASSYVDLPVSYPPDGSPYPLPGWQEYRAEPDIPAYTLFDLFPRVDSMPVAAREVARAHVPVNSPTFCYTVDDVSCLPAPGKYKASTTRQVTAQTALMAVTDAATAARFRLPTAQLCDSSGAHCVGASTTSLTRAAERFVDAGADGLLAPGPADYAAGAYPLTMPVYAAISGKLARTDRVAYADALAYVTTTGQQPGFDEGELPPGYAPLTTELRALAATRIAELRKKDPVTSTSDDDPAATPTSPTAGASDPAAGGVTGIPDAGSVPGAGVPTGAAVPTVPAGTVPVAAATESWPGFLVPFGLLIALTAGLAGPAVRFFRSFRIGRGAA